MRVRPKRTTITRRPDRSAHPVPRSTPAPPPAAPVLHPHQLRARQSGGPDDNAHYSCACGMAFTAAVSTSVECPNCGTGQAW